MRFADGADTEPCPPPPRSAAAYFCDEALDHCRAVAARHSDAQQLAELKRAYYLDHNERHDIGATARERL